MTNNEITIEENVEVKELENTELRVFSLDSEEDKKELAEDLKSNSMFFKPETDKTYKIILTSPQVKEVQKEYEGETSIKYQISIKAVDSNKEEFEGIWEVGKSVLNPIFKAYSPDATFKMTKTGTGTDTRYSVIKDF